MCTTHVKYKNSDIEKPGKILLFDIDNKKLLAKYRIKGDLLRVLAICSVIWSHCLAEDKASSVNQALGLWRPVIIEIGRPGTVMFFILSGFCFGEKIHQYNVLSYLKYRLNTLIIPWLTCLIFYAVWQAIQIKGADHLINLPYLQSITLVISLLKGLVFHAAYWFVPVAVFSACVLVAFKKHLTRPYFVAVLTAATLFYSFNLYEGWVSQLHTKAIAGYVLFMWLGIQMRQHIAWVDIIVNRLSWRILLGLIIVFVGFNYIEIVTLHKLSSLDAFGSIRLSNWLLAITLVFIVFKLPAFNKVTILKPRQTVFAVYLMHPIFIAELLRYDCLSSFYPIHGSTDGAYFFNGAILFILVTLMSFLFALALAFLKIHSTQDAYRRFSDHLHLSFENSLAHIYITASKFVTYVIILFLAAGIITLGHRITLAPKGQSEQGYYVAIPDGFRYW